MHDSRCPKCQAELTVKQAIEILNGSDYQRIAKIKLSDGHVALAPANLVNPNEVEVLVE